MPKFVPIEWLTEGRDPSVLYTEVNITTGPDPVTLMCDGSVAPRLTDARKVEAIVRSGLPRVQDYNAKLMLFLVSLAEKWPMRTPPSWAELTRVLNECDFLSPQGAPWTKANLMQKLTSLEFDKSCIQNPKGALGVLYSPVQADNEIAKIDGVLDEARGGLVFTTDTVTHKGVDKEFPNDEF